MVSRRGYLTALSTAVLGVAGCSSKRADGNGPSSDSGSGGVTRTTPSNISSEDTTSTETPVDQQPDSNTTPDGDTAIHDIREFGAAVDGVTDDTLAVRDALETAEAGDTVLFPAGTTLVSTESTSGVAAITLDGDAVPPNLTLAGHGYESVVRLAGSKVVNHKVFALRINSGFRGLTLRDFRIDGQKDAQTAAGGHAIRAADAADGGVPCTVQLVNLWVEDCHQTGISLRHTGIVVDSCTVRGCRKHGVSVSHHSGHPSDLPPFVVRNTYCTQNGKAGPAPAYGLDCADGNTLVENCVLENNAQGTKTTSGGIEVRYRRVRIADNDVNGYIRAGRETTDRTRVVFEDVVASGNGNYGFRLSEDTDYYVPTEIVATDNGDDNVRITNDAGITAETIWANRADRYGLASDTSVGGEIRQYRPYENSEGAIENSLNIEIQDSERGDKTDIESVPASGSVGAFTVPIDRIHSPE